MSEYVEDLVERILELDEEDRELLVERLEEIAAELGSEVEAGGDPRIRPTEKRLA